MPFATVNQARVHYLEAGQESSRPAVVLLHAFPLNATMWEDQMEALSPRWHVIAPDFPGFGQSDPVADPRSASLDVLADGVAGLVGELGLGQVVLGGLSMGGYAAFVLARRHRAIVRALVLADTRAGADSPEIRERRMAQQDQVEGEGTDALVEALLKSLLAEATRQHKPETVERIRGIMQEASPPAIVAALQAMADRTDASEELATLDVPTLVLVGDSDATAPIPVAQEMAERLPRARLAVIPEAGHLSSLENPSVFTAELRSFLEGLDAGGH